MNCQQCGLALDPQQVAQTGRCPRCGAPASLNLYPQQQPGATTTYGQTAGAGNLYNQPTVRTGDAYTQAGGAVPPPPPPPPLPAQPASGPASVYGPPAQPGAGFAPAQPISGPAAGFGAPAQPIFSGAPTPPPRPRSPARLIGIMLAAVIVLAGLGVGGYFVFRGASGKNANSTPTVASSPTPTILYQASLTTNPGGWTANNGDFRPDGLHTTAPDNKGSYGSFLTQQPFGNMVIEAQGTILQGDQQQAALAIAFRIPQNANQGGYELRLFANGTYTVIKTDAQGNATTLIDNVPSGAIHAGLNQPNQIKISANGSQLAFFVNGTQIGEIQDSTYTSGYLGLGAYGAHTETTFINLLITTP